MDRDIPWYRKLDIIELAYKWPQTSNDRDIRPITEEVAKYLNREFGRLNYAYWIVDEKIVEISSKQEIVAIETAIDNSANNVRLHLESAPGTIG